MPARMMALICVSDRERARDFYADVIGPVLGLGQPDSDDYGEQFDTGPAIVRLTAIPDWQPGPHPVVGWEVEDAAATVAALAARGVLMEHYEGMGQNGAGIWTSPDGATRLAWFFDSEGNLLSLAEQH